MAQLAYSKMQFLLAVSHCMSAHTDSFGQKNDDSSSSSEEDAQTRKPAT